MTIEYRDIPRSPRFPDQYMGGEGRRIFTGDMVRMVALDGEVAVVDVQGGERGVRVRADSLRHDVWREPLS